MTVAEVLSLFGGLAVFLLGMKLMGDALEKRAGSKLKSILANLTKSTMRGFLLGLGVTAVIQSSSATTVMVVGFVNSGIMELSQSVGVIMGANVGTAVTSWILSLTGISSDNPFLQLLKPSVFSQILAVYGIICVMFSKKQSRRDTGMVFLGFAVLMFGMEQMSASVKPLADMPEFTRILTMFSNPILGVLAGTVLTAVIQSSSASVGILQALSLTGAIPYATAVPIILGQNIGTCVTAVLSSMGASKDARRASMIHLYFNVIGVAVWLSAYYVLQSAFQFSVVAQAATPLGIAIIHTVFKLLSTALLMPFAKQLEKLARLTIPDSREREEAELLDERLFITPAVAIERASEVARVMAKTAETSLYNSLDMLRAYDPKIAARIVTDEDKVDMYEDKLGGYMVKLAALALADGDSQELNKLLHLIGDFERVSDHAVNILESAEEMREKNMRFSNDAWRELTVMIDAVREALSLATKAFTENDLKSATLVEPLEQVVDALQKDIKARHIQRLTRGECTIELGFVLADLLGNLERVSDHCSNIAVCEIEVARHRFDMHEYLLQLKSDPNSSFDAQFTAYLDRYALPAPEGAK